MTDEINNFPKNQLKLPDKWKPKLGRLITAFILAEKKFPLNKKMYEIYKRIRAISPAAIVREKFGDVRCPLPFTVRDGLVGGANVRARDRVP